MPSTGKPDNRHFRDYPVTGHAVDTPKLTRTTQSARFAGFDVPQKLLTLCLRAWEQGHGAQHSDFRSLVWLIAGDKAADGGSQRDSGLSEEDSRTHQSRWY